MDDLAHELHVLRPRRGDVVVVTAEPEHWALIRDCLVALHLPEATGVPILFLQPGEEIKVGKACPRCRGTGVA